MTRIEASTAMDLNMEDASQSKTLPKPHRLSSTSNRRFGHRKKKNGENEDPYEGQDEDVEVCDEEAWQTLSKSFKKIQSVLDQNRALIQQVNENHQSKIPDNLVKNVALIREIDGNISKVMGMYSLLSVNFSNIVQQRIAITKDNSGSSDNKEESSDT